MEEVPIKRFAFEEMVKKFSLSLKLVKDSKELEKGNDVEC